MILNVGDVVRYRVIPGSFMGGLEGIGRVNYFDKVKKHKGIGTPMFRAGDTLVILDVLKEGRWLDRFIRLQPHEVEFAPLFIGDWQVYRMTDQELVKFTRGFRAGVLSITGGSPELMCYAVCAPLQSLLELHGVRTQLIEGAVSFKEGAVTYWMNHYWLRLEDGRILDPTYSQFNSKKLKVYIGEKPEGYRETI